ncbi:hypothetical protein SPRG_09723 [Saprolegnia parasitica CBS 223.65]|uniref:VLIG-type G domain-containing protein n=1 Tax=Saprolegnia parasitica (strain CBS 223.65) TaxID=695850 RepID=A0A067C379_SAPPC|nr:hypothetical protein SPRG_09723 [Saprolegnia parasitica CBS 223.65]KDO24993.1 hypothetical protein SPRG_09723 [Saprolegnia parasitica CBS 223.65]|eukprot:XP_012204262.1 hypothetical protein SPRG_09723 [Saprolegnia parasitica CBS 223.65]
MGVPTAALSHLVAVLTEARAASSELQTALNTDDEASIPAAVDRLNALTAKLGLVKWTIDDDKLADPSSLFERLPVLTTILDEALKSSEMEPNLSDKEVITHASGGAVLYGIRFGVSGNDLVQLAAKPFLQPPAECTLNGPIANTITADEQFASVDAAATFRTTVKSCGKSFGLDVKGSYGYFAGSAGHHSGSAKESRNAATTATTTTSVAHVTYAVVPVKSFRLDRSSMRLTDDAINDAKNVTSSAAAAYFLEDYGSHVSSGSYHFGGIYWKTTEMSTKEATDVREMTEACRKHASSHLSAEYGALGFGVGIDCGRLRRQEKARQCDIVTRLEHTGPDAPSFTIFRDKLLASNRTWRVIDRPASSTALVGVWDLVAELPHCKEAADLIRKTWLTSAQASIAVPSVRKAMERARVNAWLCDPSVGSEMLHMEVADATAASHLAERHALAIVTALQRGSNDHGETMLDFCLFLARLDSEFDLELTVKHFRQPEMRSALTAAANVAPPATLQRLSDVFHHVIEPKLAYATPVVNLDAAFAESLKRSRALTAPETTGAVWEPPSVDVGTLPEAVEELCRPYLGVVVPDLRQLQDRLGAFLVTNLVSGATPKHHTYWRIAQGYGCFPEGFANDLTKEHIETLVRELQSAFDVDKVVDESGDEDAPEPSPFAAKALTPEGRSLSHLVRVTPRSTAASDPRERIWHMLKHRLGLEKELFVDHGGAAKPAATRAVRGAKAKSSTAESARPVMLDALLGLTSPLTPTARAEVFRLMLDRRLLVPYLVPSDTGLFRSEATPLGLIETFIGTQRASLMRDTSVTRVAVVSERPTKNSVTKDWIKGTFHVDSMHCLDRNHGNHVTSATVVELGWGFVKRNAEFTPVMVLHVVGNYKPLLPFITAFADAAIVDAGTVDDDDVALTLSHGCVVHWRNANEDEDDEAIEGKSDDVFTIAMRCAITTSHSRLTDYILDEAAPPHARVAVADVTLPTLLLPSDVVPPTATNALARTNFATLRRETFQLQLLFAQEAQLQIQLEREMNVPDRQVLTQKIRALKDQHATKVRAVKSNPLLAYFLRVLEQRHAADREMMLIDLERRLATSCEAISQAARDQYRLARDAFNKNGSAENRKAYAAALEKWSMMVTGLEHLWRELSHIFRSDPNKYKLLPRLAAQHLRDGFPLELMDGDAAMVNITWIRAVFNQLGDCLPKGTRIFVLSIMGVQSAGKSTLLNYMFGVRLRTSVSRCTRGLNIQLLQVDGSAAYDYVLLLDTEGIRSPEYIGMDGSAWRDNRMATLAILPSDATIILTKGESAVTISEILPIVLSVFLGSELVEQYGSYLTANLYFAFNQIDLTQSSNMETIVDTLMKDLRENAAKITEISANEVGLDNTPSVASSVEYFRDFRADIADMDGCDVRFFGTTHGTTAPPLDTPEAAYGDRLLGFWDHINARAMERGANWRGRTIEDFNEALLRVWTCIGTANFQLNFSAAHEQVAYEHLMRRMTEHTRELAKVYSTAFDNILKRISADDANGVPFASGNAKYALLLEGHVVDAVATLDVKVHADLSQEKFAQWKAALERKWVGLKHNQAEHSKRLVQDKVDHVFLFESQVKVYKGELQKQLTQHIEKGDTATAMRAFDTIFDRMLARIRDEHPPLQVRPRVEDTIFKNDVFSPDQRVELRKVLWSKVPTPTASWGAAVFDWFNGSKQMMSPKDAVIDAINDLLNAELANVPRYLDDVVLMVMIKAKKLTKDMSPSLVSTALAALYHGLVSALTKIQKRWDLNNSIVTKFAACKPSMKAFAENICKGHVAADLLIATLDGWLEHHLHQAFEEQLVSEVAASLKSQRWVQDAEAMQAFLDKDILERIRAGATRSVLDAIRNPKAHGTEVMTKLILAKVQQCHARMGEAIVANVKESIVVAATLAGKAETRRSERFVHEIRLALQDRLKLSGTSVLVENLPKGDNDLMNCDEQGPGIFTSSAKPSVLNAVLQSLETHSAKFRVSTDVSTSMATKVLELIRDESFGASSGVIPRCGKPCPHCRCPCTKALGHASVDDDDKLHDTYHQPAGLVGVPWTRTGILVSESCTTSVVNDNNVVFSDGKSVPFKEFDTAFPGWAVPAVTQRLPLREYVFATYQDALAEQYGHSKCQDIPSSYNHDLDDLGRTINRLCMGML